MVPERNPRHLVAILYADVVGFSRMSEADEESTFLAVRERLDHFAERIRSNNTRPWICPVYFLKLLYSPATDFSSIVPFLLTSPAYESP